MNDLLKNDIKVLDFIINEVLFKNSVNEHNLVENGLISNDLKINFQTRKTESSTKEFKRLISILKEYNVCDILETKDDIIISFNDLTLSFQNSGGFKKLFKEQKLKRKKDRLEFDNLKLQNEVSELTKINLSLQNKHLKRYILYSLISFIAGAILTNGKDILNLLNSIK